MLEIREELSFERLPQAVELLIRKVNNLEVLIKEQPTEQADEYLTIEETASFLSLTIPTIYSKVSRRELPFMKKGKRLYFSKKELSEYLMSGRKKTVTEIEAEAESYLNRKGGVK